MTSKRIILEHTTGAFKGLRQIVGTEDQLGPGPQQLPVILGDIQFFDHMGSCQLVTVKPRFALYREILPPATLEGPQPVETLS